MWLVFLVLSLQGSGFFIFATNNIYLPNFGTVEQADLMCTTQIQNPLTIKIPIGGAPAMAYISNSTVSARDRPYGVFPVYSPDGTNQAGAVWEATSLEQALDNPLGITTTQGESLYSLNEYTWTGSSPTGTYLPGTMCDNWHSASSGPNGEIGSRGVTWMGGYGARNCNSKQHLLCVQVGYPPTNIAGIIMFQTPNTFSGNFGTDGIGAADAICQQQAATWSFLNGKSFRSLLATSKATLLSRAPASSPILSLSGSIIYPSFSSAISTRMLNTQMIVTGYAYPSINYWTGGPYYTCDDWTSTASQGQFGQTLGTAAKSTNPSWTNQGKSACTTFRPILCIESVPACQSAACDMACVDRGDIYGRDCTCTGNYIGTGELGQCIYLTRSDTTITVLNGTTLLNASNLGVISTQGGEAFQIRLAVVGTNKNLNGKKYNITLDPMSFSSSAGTAGCTFVPAKFSLPSSNTGTITATCVMNVGGGGVNIPASLRWCVVFPDVGTPYCGVLIPGIQVTFPRPAITPGTIRRAASDNIGATVFFAQAAGDSLTFNGRDFICDVYMKIYLGTPTDLKKYVCALGGDCSSTTLTCVPDVVGVGGPYTFTVVAAGQNFTGTDKFYYPILPVIYTVRGCPSSDGAGTSQCPTTGRVLLEINGTNFYGNVSVLIDMSPCTFPVATSDGGMVTCNLPEGTGQKRMIIVTAGQKLSPPAGLVSFADPYIYSLSVRNDCQRFDDLTLTGCDRHGGAVLTINGSNFGSSATVRIGTSYCESLGDPINYQSQMACILPPGDFVGQPVSVSVMNGGTTTQGSITYELCPAGQETDSNNITECIACPPGYYSNGYNPETGDSCIQCPAGKFAQFEGQPFCNECYPGYSENSTGSAECDPCGEGTYSTNSGSTSCGACEIGTYAGNASNQCPSCPVGFYQNVSGQSTCSPCDPGRSANTLGNFVCDDCQPGYFLNASEGSSCFACAVGTFQSGTQATNCENCPVGKHNPVIGQAACQSCGPGQYSDTNRSTSCVSCKLNYYQPAHEATACVACQAGYYGDSDFTSCYTCSSNFYSKAGGPCEQCTFGLAYQDHTGCGCPLGTYEDSGICIPCAQGLVCDQADIMVVNTSTQVGWWRATKQMPLYRCVNNDNCVGNDQCDVGRTGILCSVCIHGYSSAYFGGRCRPCPSRARSILATIGILIGIAVALVLVFTFVLFQARPIERACVMNRANVNLSSVVNNRSSGINVTTGATHDRNIVGGTMPQSNILRQAHLATATGVVSIPEKPANLMSQFKIFIGFVQVLMATVRHGDLTWPRAFSELLSGLSFINLDFIPWQSLACVANANGLRQAEVVCAVPVLSLLTAIPLFAVLWIQDKMDYSDSDKKRLRRKVTVLKFIRIALFTCFLFYPHVSSVIVGVYNCRVVDEVSYMSTDYTILCHNPSWRKTAYPLLLGVIIYPIGVPFLFLFLIWRNREKLEVPAVMLAYGALYEPYRGQMFYFEVVDMVYKLFMTSLLPLAKAVLQLPIGMAAAGFYLMIILITDPYKRNVDHTLHTFLLADIVVLHVFGYCLQMSKLELTPLADDLISVFLIALFVCMLAFFVMMAVLSVKSTLYSWLRRKNAKEDQQTAKDDQPGSGSDLQ